MDKITKLDIVNDVIKKYPATIGVFSSFNIDTCCGGAATIEEAAKRDGAPLSELLGALNEGYAPR
jgi:regulator of cell morphogenesis and NO signaling